MTRQSDHRDLDEQHEQLHLLLIGFEHAAARADQLSDATGILGELIGAIGSHFGFEEAVMLKAGFPEFEHHLRQHLSIMTELGLMLDSFESGCDVATATRSAAFLSTWFMRHLDGADQAFFDWFDAKPE